MVIVVGVGIEPEAPYAELEALATTLDAPLIDTPKSKGAIPTSHPLFVGTIGLTVKDPAYEVLDQAGHMVAGDKNTIFTEAVLNFLHNPSCIGDALG